MAPAAISPKGLYNAGLLFSYSSTVDSSSDNFARLRMESVLREAAAPGPNLVRSPGPRGMERPQRR